MTDDNKWLRQRSGTKLVWRFDSKRECWFSNDGRRVTAQDLKSLGPFLGGMVEQVMAEASAK